MTNVNTPIQIGSITLKNRVTMAPTVKFDMTDDSACANEFHVKHYGDRARAGASLICVEATAILPGGRFDRKHIGLWNEEQMETHKAVTEAVHAAGSIIIIQLNHTGITANPECGEPIGPSAVATRSGATSIAMSIDEIHAMQEAYVNSAILAQKAGYDGIQLHACHGYLINQFASPITNLRTDEYGGCDENRARFGAEIITAIRKACGPDFLISARTTGWECGSEGPIAVAEEYVKAGCDYLQISSGIDSFEAAPYEPNEMYSQVASLGIRMHDHFAGRVPVSIVCGFTRPEQVHYCIDNTLCDTVDLGRSVLADPNFFDAILNGGEYKKCLQCKRCQYGPFTAHKCPQAR